MTRQNFYKDKRARQIQAIDEDLVVALVRRERRLQPRLGSRKLYRILKRELTEAGIKIGRDRFLKVLKKHGLLVPPLLPRSRSTTNSRHYLPVFPNLIKDLEPAAPNQVWVSDITFIRTYEGFEYLVLLMDLFSRKIVGYHCSEDATNAANLSALEMALTELPPWCHPIHHSDRGAQYCCHAYVEALQHHNFAISMTEENHCYENSHAERLNGILKQEYALGVAFATRRQARLAVDQAVWLYNNRRPHGSLNDQIPADVYTSAA